jgi:1,4-alpha-glucan branching enzyme
MFATGALCVVSRRRRPTEHRVTSILEDGTIEFRFFRPDVTGVFIAGTFNGWATAHTPMQSDGDGWWRAELCLPEGDYQFRYIADGEWYTDHAANGIERSRTVWNSVLVVPSRAIKVAA